MDDFEWDPDKERLNALRHGIAFSEAVTVFEDPLSIARLDREHSESEERFRVIGRSAAGRILIVVHSERGKFIRIISARRATRREITTYEQGNF
jgi:uncharacterized DUF497 family protein